MQLLRNFGSFTGALFSLSFGLLWGYMAYVIEKNGADAPTVWGLKGLSFVVVVGALFGIARSFRKAPEPTRRLSPAGPDSAVGEPSGFDADAAFARYMARAADAEAAPAEPRHEAPPIPKPEMPTPRPQFGRRGL